MMYEIIKPMKERIRFIAEHRNLFHGTCQNNFGHTMSENYVHNLPDQDLVEERNFNKTTTQTTITLLNNHEDDTSAHDSSENPDVINKETTIVSKEDENKENNNDNDNESTFPNIYVVPDLPSKIQQIIQTGEINEFRGHTNARRLLLDAIFTDVTTKYSLLYPNKSQYKSMAKAIIKVLNVPKDPELLNDWIESLKAKFKRERRPLQQISEEVKQMKVRYGNATGRPLKRHDNVIAPRRENPVQFWNTIDVNDDSDDLDKNIQFMKNELTKEIINLDDIKVSWKKTLVQRRIYIQNHTTKEVVKEFPGYTNVLLIFDEIQYICNVDIEANFKNMLPKLLDSIPDNSGFVNDLPTVRLIKLLSKHFTDSWQQILSNKEPLSPRPAIQITPDKFIIFLDFEVVTETSSIDQALCVIVSLYVIFELQFGAHNRIIHLLFGILLQEPGSLTRPLRLLLNQWNFIINTKEKKVNTQMTTAMLANNDTLTTSMKNLTNVEDIEPIDLPYVEEQNLTEKSIDLHPVNGKQDDLPTGTLSGDNQNPITTSTNTHDKEMMKNHSIETSQSSPSSSPISQPLIIHISSPEEPEVAALPSHSNQNIISTMNIKHQTSSQPANPPSKVSKKNISAARKRPADSEEPIASRLKRSRQKRQIN